MTAEEILVKAAELVEAPGGWCQGVSFTEAGARCMASAIETASKGASLAVAGAAYDAVMLELGLSPRNIQGMVNYNDARGRKAVEVATVLRDAKRNIHVS